MSKFAFFATKTTRLAKKSRFSATHEKKRVGFPSEFPRPHDFKVRIKGETGEWRLVFGMLYESFPEVFRKSFYMVSGAFLKFSGSFLEVFRKFSGSDP